MSPSPLQIRQGFLYVSAWVLIWGTVASIADAVLLGREAYEPGTAGQALTFFSYGVASVVLAVRFAGRFLGGEGEAAAPPPGDGAPEEPHD